MKGTDCGKLLLSAERLAETGGQLLRSFNPDKILYLSPWGLWEEGPRSFRDRVSHALFFNLWLQGQEAASTIFRGASALLLREENRTAVQKIWLALAAKDASNDAPSSTAAASSVFHQTWKGLGQSTELSYLLAAIEAFLWFIQYKAMNVNAEIPAPQWNRAAKETKENYQKKLSSFSRFLRGFLTPEEYQSFFVIMEEIETASPFLQTLIKHLAEEDKIGLEIEALLERVGIESEKEEAAAAIIEKLQPPMGIVSHLSTALFLPCLRLLEDDSINIQSGIPYMASVVLSLLQDPRSRETLLKALRRYPTWCTKIRENLIYTLGNLREGSAVEALVQVLEEPDEVKESQGRSCPLLEQKEEAIWALGKIGHKSVKALPSLAKYADHPSPRLKTYLAWTMGEVGMAQKEKTGGVNADIVIALLRLLKEKNKQIFEESVNSLRKIDMPEFVHSLYLYHTGAISILGLKPAQRGLYELSETLHYLLRKKKRTIIAVNGDSGTGKTYFCQAIMDGFAGLKGSEILYLMRDSRRGQKWFNRLLGFKWLKKHIDPAYYQDYPFSEETDDPEDHWREFLEENADKRLIILDGCRDRFYFQKVIDFLYLHRELDVEVNFRANFSTRRLNLEEREKSLESVKLHLAFLEEPALEDTSFYQEGIVILYDLDNSISSRLNSKDTKELFEKQRIDSWGDLIRIGDLARETTILPCSREMLDYREEDFSYVEEKWTEPVITPFSPSERKFKVLLNEDLTREPNLLGTIFLDDLSPAKIRFYAQDQVAGLGEKGSVFVLTFLDNRLFATEFRDILDSALLGRRFFLSDPENGLFFISFERNEISRMGGIGLPPVKITVYPPDKIMTADANGVIRVWDLLEEKVIAFESGLESITSLAVDNSERLYASGEDGSIRQWQLEKSKVRIFVGFENSITLIRPYLRGKFLAIEESPVPTLFSTLRIMDPGKKDCRVIRVGAGQKLNNISVYYDGRLIAGLSSRDELESGDGKSLLVITPGEDSCQLATLSGHRNGTKDCLVMGPKIITCGLEEKGRRAIRVWANELFVKTELSRLFIRPEK